MAERSVRDNTLECLRKYVSALNPLDPLLEFTGAPHQTVRRWIKGKCAPMGEFLIKLRYFLESRGYPIESLDKLTLEVCNYGRLVAYGLVGVEEAVSNLGIPSRQYLFRILRGDIKSSAVWGKKMREVIVIDARGEPLNHIVGADALRSAKGTALTKISVSRPGVKDMSDRQLILLALSQHITAVVPLAERVASDRFSAEDRRMLREMAGKGVVFRLSNLLHRLCGEKAREIVSANSQPASAEG